MHLALPQAQEVLEVRLEEVDMHAEPLLEEPHWESQLAQYLVLAWNAPEA
jgi:hypothetical protein